MNHKTVKFLLNVFVIIITILGRIAYENVERYEVILDYSEYFFYCRTFTLFIKPQLYAAWSLDLRKTKSIHFLQPNLNICPHLAFYL